VASIIGSMVSRERAVDIGAARGREILGRLPAEARAARLALGLGQADVAAALGISRSQVSRIERGRSPDLTFDLAARLFAVLGHELAVRTYPSGDPIRDTAHAALLERLRARCHRSFRWQTEVPLPIAGDLRAWDATAIGPACRIGIEAETRLRDIQALDRRLALKERDGGMDRLILLVLDSRSNRAAIRAREADLGLRFPVPGARALELLGVGVDPGGNALILL
jgi:transcriptional regulator with XRE-family HTH domain